MVYSLRGDCHLINHLEQCKSYTWDHALAMHSKLTASSPSSSQSRDSTSSKGRREATFETLWKRQSRKNAKRLFVDGTHPPSPRVSRLVSRLARSNSKPFPSVLWFQTRTSCLPLWPLSRGECIWLPPETCLRSKEWGGSPASSWLTCWHTAETFV